MISDFKDLFDKIARLSDLTRALRRENAELRQSNALLTGANEAYAARLSQAQTRLEALLAQLPAEDHTPTQDTDA